MDLFLKKNRHLTYFISFTLRISKDRDYIHCDVLQDSTYNNSFQKKALV